MKTDNIDVQRLKYFLVLARELHFTRVAEKVGIQQPPFSMQIRQLEKAVGASLFVRSPRHVELTAAGHMFLAAAEDIVARFKDAVEQTRECAAGQIGRLRVGFGGATYFHPDIPIFLRSYRATYPGVVVSPKQSNTPDLLNCLENGSIDVALIRPPVTVVTGLVVHSFLDEDMVIVLPDDHALCGSESLPLASIAEQPLILFPREIGPGLYDSVMSACHDAGFSP